MAKAANDLFLVQIAGCRLQTADHLHALVVLERLLPGNRDCGGWTILQFVQLEGLLETKRVVEINWIKHKLCKAYSP